MKSSRKSETPGKSLRGHNNVSRPDIRDDIDSRKEKEAGYQGVDYRPDKKPKKKIDKSEKGKGPEPFLPKKNGTSW
jgi:hypothetical protein